jgi:putative ABC transport system permease protein
MSEQSIFFSLSLRNVRLNLLRSLLASLGIIIGVVAISAVGMLGANLQLIVTGELSSSSNVINIVPDTGGGGGGFNIGTTGSTTLISENQVQQIIQVAGQNVVVPLHTGSDAITIGSEKGRASIIGIDPADVPLFLTVAEGGDLRSSSGALVGSTLASNFKLKVGSRIKLGTGDNVTRVVGILEATGFGTGLSADNALVVPDRYYTSLYGNDKEYNQVMVVVSNINDLTTVEDAIDRKLNRVNTVVRIIDPGMILQTIQQTLGAITSFLSLLAGISLLVAAVSIFNVMMMSVNERVREIGILRSIGTKRREVRRMFLYEAFILGTVGAGIGGLISFIAGYLAVSLLLGNSTYFFLPQSLLNLPYGMAVGVIICMLSGIYPAWKASNLNPIEALRHE